MKFSFKSLRHKLYLFVGLSFLVVLLFSINLIMDSVYAANESEEINSFRFPMSEAMPLLIKKLDDQFATTQHAVINHDTLGFYNAETAWNRDIMKEINFLVNNKNKFSPEKQVMADSLTAMINDYQQTQLRAFDWITENYIAGATDSASRASLETKQQSELAPLNIKLDKLSLSMRATLAVLQDDNEAAIKESVALIHKQASVSALVTLIFVFTVLLLLGAGGYITVSSLNRSIINPENTLARLVEGDTSEKAEPVADEMKNITESTNKLNANLQRASDFAHSIGEGNFNFDFQPLSEKDVLGNSLVHMRDKLRSISESDRKRSWVNEGLAKFADILRRSDDFEELSNTIICELVKYINGNQGGLFVSNHDNDKDLHLQLIACYAFERKKFLEKRVEIGEGLLGQSYLEKQRIYMEEVPANYVTITSGLGVAEPNALLIVPLKVNDVVEGVIELASFRKFEDHEMEFVEKVGEIIASTVTNARINQRTKMLLEESQEQSEQMRAQEEEMRQNMEEMQATQEQMQRQADEMRRIQKSLELERSMLQVLMEYLPDRITYKDKESRILRVNNAKAVRFNVKAEEFVGKTDYDFFDKEHADRAMLDEKKLLDSRKAIINHEERYVFASSGEVGWSLTSRIPFVNELDEVIGIIIITKDTTKQKIAESSLSDREKIIERLLDDMKVFRYTVGSDAKLHNVWKSRALFDFNPAALESKNVKDTFPEVFDLISQKDLEDTDLVCKDLVEINEEKEVFKHFLFKDSAHDNVYLGFAMKQ